MRFDLIELLTQLKTKMAYETELSRICRSGWMDWRVFENDAISASCAWTELGIKMELMS